MDWDDLRFFLAIARGGSLSAAARTLGVNHSTVLRRLARMEQALDVRLFERRPDGYGTTAAGAELMPAAARIEDEMMAIGRKLSGRDHRLSGVVRVTAPDTLALGLLPPILARFQDSHPGIEIELAVSNDFLSLSRREADVAIRPIRTPTGDMVGRRLAEIAFAVYGAEAYLTENGSPQTPADLFRHRLVGADEAVAHLDSARWLRSVAGEAPAHCRCDSLMAQLAAVRAGMGLGALPCFLADIEPALRRVFPPEPAMASALWLLTHRDLQRNARVRAFIDFMAAALVAKRDLLEGRDPNAG